MPPLVVVLPETTGRPAGGGASAAASATAPEGAAPAATTVVVGRPPSARAWIQVGDTAWGELSAEGRVVVLTHECVHVALTAHVRPDAPRWLVEGVADDVAYRRSSVPVSAVFEPLARDVAAHGVPRTLPRDSDLELGGVAGASAQLVYARALSAVRTYTRLHGRGAGLDLLRHGPRGGDPVAAWDGLEDALLPAWQEDLRRLARTPGP